MIRFKEEGHIYEGINDLKNMSFISITRLISLFHEEFDSKAQAVKSSKNKKSKWYNLSPDEIENAWKEESERAVNAGNFYHKQREKDTLNLKTITRENKILPIFKHVEEDGYKYSLNQKLQEGIYPELIVYLQRDGIVGQADRVEIYNDKVDISDYKSNKEIQKESWKKWDGTKKKMLHCLKHLDDCNYIHYALQLSIIAYIIGRHNPFYDINKLTIQHVKFEVSGENKYGYPILRKDENDEYIIKEIDYIDVPYLKSESKNMIAYYNEYLKK